VAGIHGDELNGIEIVRDAFERVRPEQLAGMLIGVPVANLHGFRRSSRYLPDRRDLNRYFPGHPAGSSASRIANALFEGVVRHCETLIDFHTGSFHRTNLPQVRADLRHEGVIRAARAFGAPIVVHSEGTRGTLRRAAVEAGIPAITYEAGEPMRFQREEVSHGVTGVFHWLAALGMMEGRPGRTPEDRIYTRSRWVRVNDGGIFLTDRELGERIDAGEILGTVTDPISNERTRVIAPFGGRIIGMALSQVVIPGFAAFHVGVEAEPLAVPPPPDELEDPGELDAEERPE
jgi:predicted deacylase